MKKHGFTLVELLVVIAIIGILSVIIVPSVINVNKNVNTRLLDQKMEHIETGATLYASKNDDLFNGVDEIYVYVHELIDLGYVSIDVDKTDSRCNDANSGGAKGCVLDPTSSGVLNNDYVILRKQGAGYTAEYVHGTDPSGKTMVSDLSLVEAVCERFASGDLVGKGYTSGGVAVECKCYGTDPQTPVGKTAKYIRGINGEEINACVIAGDNPNNYLRYGNSDSPNWRVLGIYNVQYEGSNTLVAKMITIGTI